MRAPPHIVFRYIGHRVPQKGEWYMWQTDTMRVNGMPGRLTFQAFPPDERSLEHDIYKEFGIIPSSLLPDDEQSTYVFPEGVSV